MRVQALVLFAFAAVSAPVHAAPTIEARFTDICRLFPDLCLSPMSAHQVKTSRDLAQHTRAYDESEAFNWGGAASTAVKFLPTVIGALPTVWHWLDHDSDSGNSTRRAFEEIALRAVSDDESGAVSVSDLVHWGKVLIPPVWDGVKQLMNEHNSASSTQQAQARELVKVLARAAVGADGSESGAFSLKPIWQTIKAGWDLGHEVFSGSSDSTSNTDDQQQQQQRRELVKILARAAVGVDGSESDAFNWTTIWHTIKDGWDLGNKVFSGSSDSTSETDGQQQQQQQRRELAELLFRSEMGSELLRRAPLLFGPPLRNWTQILSEGSTGPVNLTDVKLGPLKWGNWHVL